MVVGQDPDSCTSQLLHDGGCIRPIVVIPEDRKPAKRCRNLGQQLDQPASVIGAKGDEVTAQKQQVCASVGQHVGSAVEDLLGRRGAGMKVGSERDAELVRRTKGLRHRNYMALDVYGVGRAQTRGQTSRPVGGSQQALNAVQDAFPG